MRRLVPVIVVLAACGEDEPPGFPPGDEGILERMRTGALAVDEGFLQVSRSGGWPIATEDGFLFATPDAGLGPYRLVSFEGAFPETELRSEHGVAWAKVPIASPDGAGYGYMTAFNDPVSDPWSRVFRYDGARETSVVTAPLPRLERWPGVEGEGLAPRPVRVWVPAEAPTHFVYAQDGQNLFRPAGWLLQDGAGPRTLLVGIDSTPARADEYTHVPDGLRDFTGAGRGDAYADLLQHVVRPLIEARYGTPRRLAVMGSSLGGLISLHVALRFPGTFDLVASLSGTLGWGSITGREPTMIEAYAALPGCPDGVIYLDSGGGPGAGGCLDADGDGIRDDGGGSDNYCENVQMKETLEALGCGDRLHYTWAERARHDEAAWRARSPAILALFESL